MPGSQRFIAGDPLRAVAALSVVFFHISAPGLARGYVLGNTQPFGGFMTHVFLSLGLGIYIFFALSGYLLSRPFIAAFHRGEPLPDVGRYLMNRLLRIVPAFWVVTLVVVVLVGTKGATAKQIGLVFGFAQTYSESRFSDQMVQAWTLGAEMLFYLVLPIAAACLFAALGRRPAGRSRLLVVASLLGFVTVVVFAWRVHGTGALVDRPRPPRMLFAFAPGVTLAALEVLGAGRRLGERRGPAVAWACVVVGIAMIAAYVGLDRETVVARTFLGSVGSALIVAGPLVLQWTTGRAWRLLDNRVIDYLGERSYAIYLVHVPLLIQLSDAYQHHGYWAAFGLITLIGLPLSLLLAELLHRLVERPFLGLRARWRRTPAQAAVATS